MKWLPTAEICAPISFCVIFLYPPYIHAYIWHRPLVFPLVSMPDYGREKSSEIGVDGHDVLLVPHPTKAPPHPTKPTWGSGEEGWGTWGWGGWGVGWGVGGVGYLKNIVYIYYRHPFCYQDYAGKLKFLDCNSYSTIFNNPTSKMEEDSACS